MIQIYLFITDEDMKKLSKKNKEMLHEKTKGYYHPMNALYIDKYLKGIVYILPYDLLYLTNQLFREIKNNDKHSKSYCGIIIKTI